MEIKKSGKDNNVLSKWIPVSEKLPEKEGEYIVTDDAGGMATISTDELIYNIDGELIWLCSQNVTAWMPLPEPYKVKNKTEQGLSDADQDTLMSAT